MILISLWFRLRFLTHTHWILAFPYTHSLDPVFARFLHPQSSGHTSTPEFDVESSHTILKPRGIMRFASATFQMTHRNMSRSQTA